MGNYCRPVRADIRPLAWLLGVTGKTIVVRDQARQPCHMAAYRAESTGGHVRSPPVSTARELTMPDPRERDPRVCEVCGEPVIGGDGFCAGLQAIYEGMIEVTR